MVSKAAFEEAKNLLAEHGQGHLLTFWEQLAQDRRKALLGQIQGLDLAGISEWVESLVKREPEAAAPRTDLEPAPSYRHEPRGDRERQRYAKAVKLGKELISDGKVAGFVVAGGQGTRLGFEGPKGNYPISPIRQKTLFRLFAETIAAVSSRYRAPCPWYVMTSPMNHAETIEIFKANDHYGLNPKDVFVFQQGTLPNFGFDGRILLADKDRIAQSPDGHGGCIKALQRSGALADMTRRGIEYISYWQVDNPLVRLFDPLFIGLHALEKADMSSKAVIKNQPKEKVGNFCLVDGHVNVVEYSDFPDELAEKRHRDDGLLVFELGSIAIHIISRSFVERLNAGTCSLPLHRAVKKIPHIDRQGNKIEPAEPNGIKLESFIFDALPLADRSIILEIDRNEEFAPTKNPTGVDSAESTRRMMVERAANWLESAGIKVPRGPGSAPDCVLEIAPGFALEEDDVKAKRDQISPINPSEEVYLE